MTLRIDSWAPANSAACTRSSTVAATAVGAVSVKMPSRSAVASEVCKGTPIAWAYTHARSTVT